MGEWGSLGLEGILRVAGQLPDTLCSYRIWCEILCGEVEVTCSIGLWFDVATRAIYRVTQL